MHYDHVSVKTRHFFARRDVLKVHAIRGEELRFIPIVREVELERA